LTGEDRDLYLACDAIADGSRLEASGGRLKAMTERGLMLSDGAKYLSLAVPLGEYAPSGAAAARLRAMFTAAGTRSRDGIRIAFDAQERGADRGRTPRAAAPLARGRVKAGLRFSRAPLTRAHFELSGTSELFVRRSVH
jgi:hypothetical protein